MLDFWWVIAVVIGLVLLFRLISPSRLNSAMTQARKTGEVAGIVAAIEEAPEKKHPNLWDQSIGALWQEYHREAALALMVAAAIRSEAPIIQYWLKRAMEVEPQMAGEAFGEDFLATYFRPDVAARCGRTGCCG
jgi:hypothetical protein